jgi:tetratricopeptide (TPR) repeat protein
LLFRRKLNAYRAAGDLARDRRNWSRAAYFYRKYLAKAPEHAAILVQYGHALKELGKLHDAECVYRRAVLADPAEADTYIQLGHLYKSLERPSAAIAMFESALRLDPDLPSVVEELKSLNPGLHQSPPLQDDISVIKQHMTSLLDQLSTVKSLGFQIAKLSNRLDSLEAHLTSSAIDREPLYPLQAATGREDSRAAAESR